MWREKLKNDAECGIWLEILDIIAESRLRNLVRDIREEYRMWNAEYAERSY